jgi:hypothetical protein
LKESIRIGDNVLAVKKELPKPDVKIEVKPIDENKKLSEHTPEKVCKRSARNVKYRGRIVWQNLRLN